METQWGSGAWQPVESQGSIALRLEERHTNAKIEEGKTTQNLSGRACG